LLKYYTYNRGATAQTLSAGGPGLIAPGGTPGKIKWPELAPVAAVCGFARRYVAQLLPVVLVSAGSPPTWESQQASASARVCTRRPEAAAWWLRHRPATARSLRASGARGGRMRRCHLGQYVVQCR
jgi:hypothetical protein